MDIIKKILGLVWIVLAAAVAYFSYSIFGGKLTSGKTDDLVFGIILFFILVPLIVIGLGTFGLYSIKGEYDEKNM